MKKYILSTLLHYANRNPPTIGRERFYEIKSYILSRYGSHKGKRIQHVINKCWSCEDGVFKGYHNAWEWVDFPQQSCYKCNGTGVYNEFYSLLLLWKLGNYEFHTFVSRTNPSDQTNYFPKLPLLPAIKGKIEHKSPKHWLCNEAILWLFLFYDRKLFYRKLKGSMPCGRFYTPMNILNQLIFKRHNYFNRSYFLFKYHQWTKPKQSVNEQYNDEDLPF